jgi:GT2 family glycosyltransferase
MSAPPAALRFTLVVMTRERPEGLRRCLESIAALDPRGPRAAVVVVDDGSLPPSREVAESFAGRLHVRYVYQDHRGVAAARHRGLELATGEFVGFLADDYRLPPDYLRLVDDFFAASPAAQVISFSIAPAGASPFRGVQEFYQRLALAQFLELGDDPPPVVASLALPASRAAVFRRAVFERVGGFDESLRVGEDGDLGRRLAALGIPVHLFLRHTVEHHDGRGLGDYLRQRVRYGRSFTRVLGAGAARPALARHGALALPLLAGGKLREWWSVAGRLGELGRCLRLSPFLYLFLVFFYLGALRELREGPAA